MLDESEEYHMHIIMAFKQMIFRYSLKVSLGSIWGSMFDLVMQVRMHHKKLDR